MTPMTPMTPSPAQPVLPRGPHRGRRDSTRGRARLLPVGCWWGLLAGICAAMLGCSSTHQGEFSAMACQDELDNDGDKLWDCDDPDCEVWTRCAPGYVGDDGGGGASLGAGASPGSGGDGTGGGPGSGGGGAGTGGTGGGSGGGDAPSPRYLLRPVQARVPQFDAEMRLCYDFCGVVPETDCRCMPDPYVELRYGAMLLASTSTVVDSLAPSWEDGGAVVGDEVIGSGELLIIVRDADRPGIGEYFPDDIPESDDELLRCRPDLSMLAPGPLDCRVPGTELSVTLEVIALDE